MMRSLFASCLGARDERSEAQAERRAPPQEDVQAGGIVQKRGVISETQDALDALEALQDQLAALPQGSWLARAHALLTAVACSIGATEVRLYGVAQGGGDQGPSRLILLASTGGGRTAGARSYQCHAEDVAPLLPGHEVWPQFDGLGRAASAGPSLRGKAKLAFGNKGREQQQQQQQRVVSTELCAVLFGRMLGTKAPVLWSRPEQPLAGEPAAAGGTLPASAPAAAAAALLPLNTGCGLAGALWIARHDPSLPAGAPPASASVAPCPSLLASPASLRQLSLSASMCLFGSEAGHVALLARGLRQLVAAGSVHQLAGGLCDAVADYARQRFMLEPQVVAALLPEPGATVGLMLRRGEQDGLAFPAGPPPAKAGLRRMASVQSVMEWPEGSAGQMIARAFAGVRNAGPAAALTGKAPGSDVARVKSDSHPRHILIPQLGGATSAVRSGGNGASSSPRVATMSRSDLAASAAALASSVSVTHVRAKPFPLAQTLIQELARKAAAAAAAAAAPDRGGAPGGQPPGPPRALGMEVADCTAHVQDPRQAARDVLLLLMAGGMAAGPSYGGRPGGASPGEGGGGGMRSLVLLVMPVGGSTSAVLGLYVMFSQQLPARLLGEVRRGMLEVLEVRAEEGRGEVL
ncbi:hypothetical protein TSOC_006248 [Tetrabaena socialis]|uniref:Uncharacterized protein n=1 Tax=Tetrabaena socialis TaxID=47790 RepID=A0A2J8A4D0_9CHLO|nr:hypothetical protein TSOC_006248 [Tetrabaena socialis]|eukprot:PNH07374.1 hypothetical protein TSOC_006248 [Tetrabaena socialis]